MSEQLSTIERMGRDLQHKQRPPSNLNLRHNDNAFHVLASLLVEFFHARLVVEHHDGEDKRIVNISSEDKTGLQRLLPKTAMWDFVDAVSYRLEMTPVVPTTPIHSLTVQCQELCFDKDEIMENPILATYEITTTDTVTINLLALVLNNEKPIASKLLDDDSGSDGAVDYRGTLRESSDNSDDSDGFVHTNIESNSSDMSSSDGSCIKVASSNDIADEMMQQEDQKMMTSSANQNKVTAAILSDDDSMPTEYDEEDFEEFLNNDKVDVVEAESDHHDVAPCDDEEIGNEIPKENTAITQPADVSKCMPDESNVAKNLSNDGDEIFEGDSADGREMLDLDVIGPVEDEGEEIEVLPTITDTFDDATNMTCQEMHRNNDNEKCDDLDSKFDPTENEKNDTDIGEEIEVLPTETIDDTTDCRSSAPIVVGSGGGEVLRLENDAVDITTINHYQESIAVSESLPVHTEEILLRSRDESTNLIPDRDYDKKSDAVPHDTAEKCNKMDIAAGMETRESDAIMTTDKQTHESENSPYSGTLTEEDTVTVDENYTIHMQDVAGTFFSELRDAIDAKVEAFEYALVNAIVSKPIQRPLRNVREVSSVKNGRKPIKVVIEKSAQKRCENLVHKAIVVDDQSFDANVSTQSSGKVERTNEGINCNDKMVPVQTEHQNINTNGKELRDINKQVSPAFSVHSGLTSIFAGLAAGFVATDRRSGDSVSVQTKSIISTFPSDESHTKDADHSVIDYSAYETMEVVDTATKQQLLLEIKEACQLMRQSITPETTRFWSNHIQSLKAKLEALEKKKKDFLEPTLTQQIALKDDRDANYQYLATVPAVASDVQSTAMMSEIRSTKGIPVVPAISQFSNNLDDQYQDTYYAQSIPNLSNPSIEAKVSRDFVGLDNNEQHCGHPEIELSENRGVFVPNPSDELYPQPLDSNTHQHHAVNDDDDDDYYEYPLVDVVAPADLPGGYHFEAEIEGQRFLATVPPGGVQQGETFTCFMKELDSVAIDIPVGAWKDGLFNMLELGWCHPVLWNAIFCPLIALGQIQTRVHLDFLGRPKFGELPYTNRFVMLLVIASWVGMNVSLFAACNLKWSRGLELSVADECAFVLVNVAMFGFVVFVTQSTRSSVREKFMIRERCCYDLEDVCCAALCLPCTVGQMQRHTANYDDYEAVCCSKSGLPNGVRVNQEPAKAKDTTVENEDGFMV